MNHDGYPGAGINNEPLSSSELQRRMGCMVGYCDGANLLLASGTAHGQAVAQRGEFGFGFDACFMPDCHTKTFAKMPPQEKDAVSHRSIAVADLMSQFKRL